MSLLLQTGVVYHPDSTNSKEMGAGSEPDTMEAPVAPEDSHQPPPAITTYHHCFGLPYQDHNYGAPPPPTPPQSPPKINGSLDEDTTSTILSTTSTAEENEQTEESITRCICEFDHDDEYMICCDKCQVWQHVDCMGIDRNNIPDTYMCEKCQPRKVYKQKAVALQTKKREEMSDSSSDESGDENATYTTVSSTPTSVTLASSKSKVIKKKVTDNRAHKRTKKCKSKIKEKEDSITTSKLSKKRVKVQEAFIPVNEDTRDSWETALILFSEKYEEALINHYSVEVQQILGAQKLNGHHDETTKLLDQLQVQLCKVISMKHRKALVAAEDICENQLIIEYRGKFMLRSHFESQNPFFKRFDPFVLFYTKFNNIEICVDSREYGNLARFIRRSCAANSEVRHVVESGSIHLCIYSIEEIKREEEITIPFDFNYQKCDYFVECACSANECFVEKATRCHKNIEMGPVAKRRRTKRSNSSVDVDSNHSSGPAGSVPPNKCRKLSPLRVCFNQNQQASDSVEKQLENHVEQEESEEILAERRKKMTREERKMEAIMKAFAKMERTEKRRQQALERLANSKLQQTQSSPTELLVVLDQQSPVEQQSAQLQPLQVQTQNESHTSISETSSEESKPNTPAVSTRSHARGKKTCRKVLGSQARWRNRVNSGSSDALSPDENSPSMPSTPLTAQLSSDCSISGTPSSAELNSAFKFPKTKKFLMNEWLNEKAQNVSKPLLIKTEPPELSTGTPTCYVKSARNAMSLTHLRRTSSSSHGRQSNQTSLGSAKKRWLRQAMCETGTSSREQNSPLANGCPSPIPECNSESPSISPPADLLTPLKKRRLMRESLSDGTGDTPPRSSSLDTPSLELADLCEKEDSMDELATAKNGMKLHFSTLSLDENSNDDVQVWSSTLADLNFISEVESKSPQIALSNTSKDSSLQVSSSTEKSDDSFESLKDSPVKEESANKNSQPSISDDQKDIVAEAEESEPNLLDENESSCVALEAMDSLKSLAESPSNSIDLKETRSPDSSCNNSSSNNVSKTLVDNADTLVHKTDSETVSASSSSDNSKNCINDSDVLLIKQESVPDSMEVSPSKLCDPESGYHESTEPCVEITDISHGSPSSTTNSVAPATESSVCNSTSDDNKPSLSSSIVSSSSSSSSSSNTSIVNSTSNITSVNNTSNVSSSETNSTETNSCATLGPPDNRPVTSTVTTTTIVSSLSSTTITTTTTITPQTPAKKKVSLLEYRLRKRDSITKTSTPIKISALSSLTTPPKGPVTLSPLPLFESISPATENGTSNFKKTADGKRDPRFAALSTGSTEDGEQGWNNNSESSDRGSEVRENLTQRLRREFGLIDDEKEKPSGSEETKSSTRSLRLPPPPPPPSKEQCIPTLPSPNPDLVASSNHTALQPNSKPHNLYGASPAVLNRPAITNGPRNIPTIISLQTYPPSPSRLPPPHPTPPPSPYGYQPYNKPVVHSQPLPGLSVTGQAPMSNHNNFRQPLPPQFGPTPRPPILHPSPHQPPPVSDQGQAPPPLMPSGNYNEQCPCSPVTGYHDQPQASSVPPLQHYFRDPNKSYNPPPSSLQPPPPRSQSHFNQGYYQ